MRANDRVTRKLAAVLIADVKDYSRLMGESEEDTLRALMSYRELASGLIAGRNGRVVGTAGDSLLAEFASAVDAVRCAAEIQQQLAERNAGLENDRRLELRIGVNLGDVIVAKDDIYGDGVNVAARLQTVAEPGGVCISGAVYDAIKGKLPYGYKNLGAHRVKNIAEPVRAYRLLLSEAKEGETLPLPDKPSVVVLPFDNISGDPEQEYFSDGITEDITTELSKISGLFVIARHSAFTFKGEAANLQKVGRELGVRYVLEGSVRKAGDRIRINAQLVETGTGGHLWAERYDRRLEDIFALQDEVTQRIVDALKVELMPDERNRGSRTDTGNLEAYDYMLRGNEQFHRLTKDAVAEAQRMYARAIDLDPDYAAAYAWVARSLLYEWISGWQSSDEEAVDRASEFARKAVALDDSLAFGHSMLGFAHLWKRQHESAIREGERAIALDPNDADAHAFLAFTLTFAGRPEEALGLVETAMRLNPHYPVVYLFVVANAYFVMERYEDSIAALTRCIVRNPDFLPAHLYLAAIYGLLGRKEEARAEAAEMKRISPNYPGGRTLFGYKDQKHVERFYEGWRQAWFS